MELKKSYLKNIENDLKGQASQDHVLDQRTQKSCFRIMNKEEIHRTLRLKT